MRAHWDRGFAREVGAPSAYDYGGQRIAWIIHGLTNWCGDAGMVRGVDGKLTGFNVQGDATWCKARVTDKQIVVEIDGHTTAELLDVAHVFTKMSDQIIIKIPCAIQGLEAFAALAAEGVETFCTTTFNLTQAAVVAQAGATHILPFCEPYKSVGVDPVWHVSECVEMFAGWEQRPYITAALVRSVDVANAALQAGADGIIVFWEVFRDMLHNPLTDEWNATFLERWEKMHEAGLLEGVPVAEASH